MSYNFRFRLPLQGGLSLLPSGKTEEGWAATHNLCAEHSTTATGSACQQSQNPKKCIPSRIMNASSFIIHQLRLQTRA
jgi:hypothetical protein